MDSVSVSNDEVASSNKIIELFFIIALAIDKRCFSPPDNLTPFSPINVSNLFGKDAVKTNMAPSMGAEDFAYMLEKIPGSYIWLGAGEGKSGCMLHNSKYDFNDDILPLGIAYWEQLVKSEMPLR